MKVCCIAMAGLLGITSSFAGTITGTVRAQGPPELERESARYESRRFKFAERVDYDQLRDYVVYIEHLPVEAPPEKAVAVVAQKNARFIPRVLPILVGTTVEWPNFDDIYHNVFSLSEPGTFDLGLYRRADGPKRVTFEKPGRVDVFCSIHKDMHCIILVLENPYFATTDERNRYSISNVPPGTYRLTAWHERVPSRTKEVTVPAEGEVKVDFVLGFSPAK